MGLVCPACQQASLMVVARLELPPDARSDEIAVQVLSCSRCDAKALGIYEESRRGALDSESWSHLGYPMEPEAADALAARLARCPHPGNARCGCATHRSFKRPKQDWRDSLRGVRWNKPFAVRYEKA